uniref:(northern house mosquito) hypothetical protein n=1 Tax=Culex pipiens TaxID=7175 RepID=A0A8D8AKF1_CULPI
MGTVIALMVILSIVINGPGGHTFAAPVQNPEAEHPPTSPNVVRLVHYLTYLLDYIIRHYVPDWSLHPNQNATHYFEEAILEGRTDEPRQDVVKRPAKPDEVTAEKTIQVVDQLSHEIKP